MLSDVFTGSQKVPHRSKFLEKFGLFGDSRTFLEFWETGSSGVGGVVVGGSWHYSVAPSSVAGGHQVVPVHHGGRLWEHRVFWAVLGPRAGVEVAAGGSGISDAPEGVAGGLPGGGPYYEWGAGWVWGMETLGPCCRRHRHGARSLHSSIFCGEVSEKCTTGKAPFTIVGGEWH